MNHVALGPGMQESDLIDVDSFDSLDDQTWLFVSPKDSGEPVNIIDWSITCDWPVVEDAAYSKSENQLWEILDTILKNGVDAMADRHKFDSRTYIRPKRFKQRPMLQSMAEHVNQSSQSSKNYLTYNKYTDKLIDRESVSPMLRLKTFNVDANTDNSHTVKEYALKRRSLVQDDDIKLDDVDVTLVSDGSGRLSNDQPSSKPIQIDYSQPAHNVHGTFNKGMMNLMSERGSLNMYRSGESLMRMSPPSLVSSINMEGSGNYNMESLDSRKSMNVREPGSTNARESLDPMFTSMTVSILEDKDMSTSFLSQSTYPDHDSLMDCMPPSLVSSVNSSFVVPNTAQNKSDPYTESNVFSSATFTQLDQSERLLAARPRCHMFNSFTKRDSNIRNSTSYTKSKEESTQAESILTSSNKDMAETITLHYSNSKYGKNAEKENYDNSFKTDDAFYRDMELELPKEQERNSLNLTLNKQELNEIIQARQKLSLARKALPTDPEKNNQVISTESPNQTIQLPNQTIKVPKQSIESVNDILSRRRFGLDTKKDELSGARETPKRNATFKKISPRMGSMDTTMVFGKDDKVIDINDALMDLAEPNDRTLKNENWGSQEPAMVGSNESTDTGTYSSSSPPDSVPERVPAEPCQIVSTPLTVLKKGHKSNLLNLTNISPIYNTLDDKSYIVTNKVQTPTANEGAYDTQKTVINTATLVKKSIGAKRDILAGNSSPEKRNFSIPTSTVKSPVKSISTVTCTAMAPPVNVPRKSTLPTSKLRQYSSHRELSRIPGAASSRGPAPRNGAMLRRNVYASNPALCAEGNDPPPPIIRRDSYTLHTDGNLEEETTKPLPVAPPALVRQGTETLRRERPLSQLVQPKELRVPSAYQHLTQQPRTCYTSNIQPPSSRPNSGCVTQLRNGRALSAPGPKYGPAAPPAPSSSDSRPSSGADRSSGLPRPSRLPAPRRGIRPPSVYSVAPTADVDRY